MDVAAALARVDGDQEFLGEMTATFMQESPRLMAQIRAAVEAVDPAELVAPAHNLKNWTNNLVAHAALEAVVHLEALGRAGLHANAGTALATLEREIERLGRAMTHFERDKLRSHPIPGACHVPSEGDSDRLRRGTASACAARADELLV